MKKKTHIISAISALVILLLLIIDTETAKNGAYAGIELCIKVLLPSLFPFFLAITYANSLFTGYSIPGLHFLCRFLQISPGGEPILLLGFLGGYPVGAQLIGDMCKNNQISKGTAKILLGYCSNAGPSFIFGVTGLLFSNHWVPAIIWLVHIVSAVLTGFILPRPSHSQIKFDHPAPISLAVSMQNSIRICSTVCGWVVTFQIIQSYILKITQRYAHSVFVYVLRGLLELSSGCIALQELNNEPLRFILTSGFLAFGGVCVILQTISVTQGLGMGLYLPGKMIQTAIALIISALLMIQHIKLATFLTITLPSIFLIITLNTVVKKRCGNPKKNHV